MTRQLAKPYSNTHTLTLNQNFMHFRPLIVNQLENPLPVAKPVRKAAGERIWLSLSHHALINILTWLSMGKIGVPA